MTETQKRIRAYQKALPSMKERVMAVALLLVISISMMTSATFAWITLSRAPEVTGMATSFAANGNLEIALSDTDGLQPDESAVGDGATDENGNRNITVSNLTWGNLINLSDTSYGLDSLVLRPATLNTRDLINSPMSAVQYGADGRVIQYITDFAFSNYGKQDNGEYAFAVPGTTQYGVRAVSSVTYKDFQGDAFLRDQLALINRTFTEAQGQFTGIYMSDSYMGTIGYLMEVHVNSVLGGENLAVRKNEVENLLKMANDLESTMVKIGSVIVEMINLYQYMSVTDVADYHPYTFDDLFKVDYTEGATFANSNLNNTVLNSYVDEIPSITTFTRAWKDTVNACNEVRAANAASEVFWDRTLATGLGKAADLLCVLNEATLNDKKVGTLAASMSEAAGIVTASSHWAVLTKGALKDADQLIDGNLLVAAGRVSVSVATQPVKDRLGDMAFLLAGFGDSITLKPRITTAATPPPLLDTDYKAANQRASEDGTNLKGKPVAADTYAMAVDFWLRTNADDSLLILEGETKTKEVPLTDENDNPILDEQGNQLYETVVLGYQGVNRVWDELDDENSEASLIIPDDGISGTQGSGSCYVFYSTDPEQQSQTKNMLRAMRVAFVNSAGDLMVEAYMDVDHALEQSGRVIVPLVLFEQTTAIETADGQSVTRYIQAMPQNIAQRITAIIYLDGEILTNSEVLDAGSIKGQLNIQFGTTKMELDPMEDNDVMASYYTLDFYHNGSMLTEGQVIDLGAYDPATANVTLRLNVAGSSKPSSVKGSFLSIINSTQGAKQREFTMTKGADGYWTANIPFSGPGNFELRSLQIDGVDVPLDASDIVRVNIDGIALQSLFCFNWPEVENAQGNKVQALSRSVMTAESYYQQEITVGLASNEIHSVRGVFIGDNGKNVSVNFTNQDGSLYRGKANFNASGTYELTYLEIDGAVTPLEATMCRTITLQLGLRAYVTIGEPVPADGAIDENALKVDPYDPATGWSFIYTCEEPLTMPVSFMIFDDQNKSIENLSNVRLVYGVPGSDGILLDTDAEDAQDPEWNATKGTYDGAFLFQSSGVFAFRHVIITQDNQVHYVTVATGAPTITSIPPDAMEYVPQDDYAPLTYELGASRDLSISLKNAKAATLDVVLTNGDGDTHEIKGVRGGDPDANGVSTFTVQAPSDGQWTITEAYVSTVFYKENDEDAGKFYSGSVEYDADGAITKDDRLHLADLPEAAEIVDGEIGSYFLTQVNVGVTGAPNTAYNGAFMTDHEVNNMVITVTNPMYVTNGIKEKYNPDQKQEKVLAVVLNELKAKFPEKNIDSSVSVELAYSFKQSSTYRFDAAASGVPETSISREGVANQTGVFAVPKMNFKLAGTYTPTFKISIGNIDRTDKVTSIAERLTADNGTVTVTWISPSVTITAISPNGSEFAIDDKASGKTTDTSSGSGCNTTYTTASAHKNAGQHSYVASISNNGKTATVYIICDEYSSPGDDHECVPAQVTMTMNQISGVTGASLSFTKEGGGDVHMYGAYSGSGVDPDTDTPATEYTWSSWDADGLSTCMRYIGKVSGSWGQSDSKVAAGTLVSQKLTLTYDGVTYELEYPGITIHNPC